MPIFIHSGLGPTTTLIELDACPGTREVEGTPEPCPEGCVAHFDAWANPRRHYEETGGAYSPFPNSVLSWAQHFPGSVSEPEWSARDHACSSDQEASIRAYHNDTTFCDARGVPVPVWVVILDGETDQGHHAALFDNAEDAQNFYRTEIAWYESDCICGI